MGSSSTARTATARRVLSFRRQKSNLKSQPRTRQVPLSNSYAMSRRAKSYLSTLLPEGWERDFQPLRAGSYFGLPIECKKCGFRPPSELQGGGRRWRFVAVHMATAHR